MISGLGYENLYLGYDIVGFGCGVSSLVRKVLGSGYHVSGLGFEVSVVDPEALGVDYEGSSVWFWHRKGGLGYCARFGLSEQGVGVKC